jgi:hypothetical protein
VDLQDDVQDFYYVGAVAVGVTTFTDDVPDENVDGGQVVRFNQAVPACFKLGVMFGERMFGFGFDPITTGTATVNADPTLIDFAGVVIPDGVAGCWFQKAGEAKLYRIKAWVSGTQIQLENAFTEALAGEAYKIFRYEWEIPFSEFGDVEAAGPAGEAYRWRREVPGKRGAVVGVALGERLYVFTLEDMYAIYGKGEAATDVHITPDPVYAGLGCVGTDALCAIDNQVFFLSLRGPAMFDGVNPPKLIGEKLGTDWLTGLAPDKLALAAVGTDGRCVWFAIPAVGESENSKVWRYDRSTDAWFEERWTYPAFYLRDRDAEGNPALMYAQGHYVVQTEKGTRDLAPSGLVAGTVDSSTTTSLTTAAGVTHFYTTGGGLAEAVVHVFSAAGVLKGSRRITSSTDHTLNWSATGVGGGNLTTVKGDTFLVGPVWWWWKTRTWEVPAQVKQSVDLHVGVENPAAAVMLRKTEFVDNAAETASQPLLANRAATKWPVNRRDCTVAFKVENREGDDVGLRHLTVEGLPVESDQ